MPAKWTAHRCILGRQAVSNLSAAVCHSLDTDTHCHRLIILALSVRKVLCFKACGNLSGLFNTLRLTDRGSHTYFKCILHIAIHLSYYILQCKTRLAASLRSLNHQSLWSKTTMHLYCLTFYSVLQCKECDKASLLSFILFLFLKTDINDLLSDLRWIWCRHWHDKKWLPLIYAFPY